MSVTLDNTNVFTFFWSLLKMLRVDILEKFTIPVLGVSYWDFIIGIAIASVVITVLVSGVRVGIVARSGRENSGRSSQSSLTKTESGSGDYGSMNRAMHQRNH